MEEIEVIAECYVLSNIKIGEFAIKKIIFCLPTPLIVLDCFDQFILKVSLIKFDSLL